MPDAATKPLEELIQGLPPELQARVREYAESLFTKAAREGGLPKGIETSLGAEVSLREITGETVIDICKLSDTLTSPQSFMVAPNALSIAQAHFEEHAWFRGIYADEIPVGFIMLYDGSEEQHYFLWRLMVAQPHQGKGFGRRAMGLLIDYVRTRPGAQVLETSCGQGPGSPEGFYRELGFRRSGKMFDDEVGLILPL